MMKNIKIIAFLCFCCVWNFCLGQEIEVLLNIREGLSFTENKQFGINKTGEGTIKVEVFDSLEYKDNHDASDCSFMYGFEAAGNTEGIYKNTKYTYEKYDNTHWWCEESDNWCGNGESIEYNSKSLKLFKKAVLARDAKFSLGQQKYFHIIGDSKTSMDVTIKLTLSDGDTLDEIIGIKIPGVKVLIGEYFKDIPNGFQKIAIIGNSGYQGSTGSDSVSNFIKDVVKPDMILSAGNDSYSRGNAPKSEDYYDFMVGLKRYFSVPGNLDYSDSDNNHTKTKGENKWLRNFNRSDTNYTFSSGDVQFFMINTNNRVGPKTTPEDNAGWKKMNTWLEEKLLASDKKYKIVVGHHSAYKSGQKSSLLHTINFKEMGVDMYISAGSNFYERHNINGIPHVNVGLGGMDIDSTEYPESSEELVENTHFAGKFGVLTAIEVPNGLKFEFLAVDGHKKDEFYLTGWQDNYYNKRGSAITNNDESMDVYLILGQSNASARCAGSLCWKYDKGYPENDNFSSKRFPDEMGELDNTYLLNELGGFEKATYGLARYSSVGKVPFSQAIGVGWTFAQRLTKNDKKLGLIVNSRGGTTINVWQKKYAPSAIEKAEYKKFAIGYKEGNLYNETTRRLSAALYQYPNAKFKGVIWLHGESDATKVNSGDVNYATETQKFIDAIRTDFKVPKLPFLITEVSKRVKPANNPQWSHTMVNEQIHKIAENDKYVKVASVNGLTAFDAKPLNNDVGIHWDHESYRTLGKRLADFVLDYKIQVYRDSSLTPVHTYTPDDNIVVYEGDSVVFKSKIAFERLEGLTDLAIQRYAGESLFMSNAVKHGAHKPFLFYDSNVHGIKMRPYPESWANGNHKYPTFSENQGEYTISWIANTRRDYLYTDSTDNNNVSFSAYKDKNDFTLGDLTGFPNENKFSGNTEYLNKQRNNQKEGLNLEIINAYLSNKNGVAGLDPDELIYKNFAQSKISGENIPSNTNFTYVTGDEWKKLEPNHPGDINYSLQQSLNKIGKIIDPNNYYDYNLSEIMDKNLYIHKNSTESIDGKSFDYKEKQPMFNNKRPIVYSPSTDNKPIFHNTTKIVWINQKINIAVLSPLEGKKHDVAYNQLTEYHRTNPKINFYGIIKGPTFVARYQKKVIYKVDNLPSEDEVPGKFELVYTNEDANGFITTQRKQVYNGNNSFSIADFGGGGYHEITLQYTRNKTKGTPVIIAGKELIEVDLRFIFAPDEKSKDFSYNPGATFKATDTTSFKGRVKLSEQKGNGNHWFLSSQSKYMQKKTDGLSYGLKHGYEDPNVVRTYVLSDQERLKLSVLDADPHGFIHYNTDWYLSERRLSKRITDNELKNVSGYSYIKWSKATNLEFTDAQQISTGKHCDFYPPNVGTYYVKAEFNNTNKIIVKIKVRNTKEKVDKIISTAGQNLGVVNYYPLNDNQFAVLKSLKGTEMGSTTKDDYKILAIQDILSTYAYGAVELKGAKTEAPRYKVNEVEVGEHKRFSPQNNFDARFDWTIRNESGATLDKTSFTYYDFDHEADPTLGDWFPKNWIRHLDGTPQSPEIPDFNSTPKIYAFNETDDPEIEGLNNNAGSLYEPWQVRLPWIAQTGVHGYKTRWNIKTVFDINKMFALNHIGDAYREPGDTAYDYHTAVNGTDGSKIIPSFDGDAREKQEFFQHLKSGRMIILRLNAFSSEPSDIQAKVTNNPQGTTPLGTEIYNGNVTLKTNTNTNNSRKALNTDKIVLEENVVHVYPNPSKSGVFNVNISTTESSLVTLELFDVIGKSIYKEQFTNQIGKGTIKIGEGLPFKTGIYTLKITINGETTNKKLIIE